MLFRSKSGLARSEVLGGETDVDVEPFWLLRSSPESSDGEFVSTPALTASSWLSISAYSTASASCKPSFCRAIICSWADVETRGTARTVVSSSACDSVIARCISEKSVHFCKSATMSFAFKAKHTSPRFPNIILRSNFLRLFPWLVG